MIYKIHRFSDPPKKNKSKGLAVLEISSGGVKLLIGPRQRPSKFNASDFKYYKTITNTKSGIRGGKMDIPWFSKNVLPVILGYLELASGCKVVLVATAWARECENSGEVLKLIPGDVKILSGQEEAGLSLTGYLNSTARDLRDWKNILSVDLGNLSTELALFGGPRISVPKNDISQIKNFLRRIAGKTLVAISKSLYDQKTGKPDRMFLHDREFKDETSGVLEVIESGLPSGSLMVYNGTNLSFGVYYDNV